MRDEDEWEVLERRLRSIYGAAAAAAMVPQGVAARQVIDAAAVEAQLRAKLGLAASSAPSKAERRRRSRKRNNVKDSPGAPPLTHDEQCKRLLILQAFDLAGKVGMKLSHKEFNEKLRAADRELGPVHAYRTWKRGCEKRGTPLPDPQEVERMRTQIDLPEFVSKILEHADEP